MIFTLLLQSKVLFGAIRRMGFLRLQVVCIAGGRAVEDFAYWVKVPKDNGYGICVISRLALPDITLREVVKRVYRQYAWVSHCALVRVCGCM